METPPAPPASLPRPRATLRGRLARAILAAFGWRVDIAWPEVPRAVIIVYPHTSNWDFVVGYLAKLSAGLPATWIGKHTLFRPPFGAILRRMGGVPVDRRASSGFIGGLADEMRRRPWMWIAIAPEGTRKRTDHWRSGFYHLARAADAPVGLAFIDWRRREIGLRRYLALTGDVEADLESLRAAYADKAGKLPEQASEIRFR